MCCPPAQKPGGFGFQRNTCLLKIQDESPWCVFLLLVHPALICRSCQAWRSAVASTISGNPCFAAAANCKFCWSQPRTLP